MVEAQSAMTTPDSGVSLSNNSVEPKTEQTLAVASGNKPEVAQETVNPVAVEQEKTLKQSEVDKLVGRVKHEAAEKARKEAFNDYQRQLAAQPIQPIQQNTGGIGNVDIATEVRNQSILLAQQMRLQQEGDSLRQKIELAKEKYPDFEKKVMEPLRLRELPIQFAEILNSVDNIGDCLKEMADNPTKFTEVANTAVWNPELGKKLLFKLSDSIKKNEEVFKQSPAPQPLDQLKHSPTGTDSGVLTIKDFKKQPWLRG